MPEFHEHEIMLAVPTLREHAVIASILGKRNIKHLVCGAGIALSAMRLALYLSEHDVKVVILAGIAGCYMGNADVMDVVCATSEVFGDTGRCQKDEISDIHLSHDELPIFFNLNADMPDIVKCAIECDNILAGPMVTVACTSASPWAADRIQKRFPDALCENMEGASAAMVCRHFNIPLIELRGISNIAGDPDRDNWQIADALEATGRSVKQIIEKIVK